MTPFPDLPSAARLRCPAKLNLTLHVVGRRADGYHLIESQMVPIAVFDTLEVRLRPGPATVELVVEGRGGVPEGADNLVARAASLFLERTGCAARVDLRLAKVIPVGAGLGGGSSDAAAVLRVLNAMLDRPIGADCLSEWALELGADVPFFLACRPSQVSGIGEVVSRLFDWPTAPLVVAFRGLGVATAAVYARFDAPLTSPVADSTIPDFPSQGRFHLRNDLEGAACQLDSGISRLKEELIAHGATAAGMSGSGSAVFGLFADLPAARRCAERVRGEGGWAEVAHIMARPEEIERLDPEQNWK